MAKYQSPPPKISDEAAIHDVKLLFQFLSKDQEKRWLKIKTVNKLWKAFGCFPIKKDDDYEIEFLEFLGAFIAITNDIFNEYDKDEKGYLVPRDLVKLGDKYLDNNIDMVFFQGADVDGNHQVSYGEFMSHFSRLCQQKMPWL